MGLSEIGTKAPPQWKMLIVTVVVIFALSTTLLPWLRERLNPFGWPDLMISLIGVITMVTLMTYLVMPFITNTLSGWLYKNN
jgi:uncharacterized protein